MQSTKPYLIRALHEWYIDQGFTPYLSVVVDAMTSAPAEFIKNGEIVFNIGLDATNQLQLGNDEITFQGRFSGKVFPVIVPIARVAAIYARESSEGMAFEVTESVLPTLPADSATTLKTKPPMLSSVEREPAAKENSENPENPASTPAAKNMEGGATDTSLTKSLASPNRPALTRIK
jgi:stringent starvation protein B